MTLCFFSFLSPCPRRLFLACLPQIGPPPAGSGDERAAAMIAWRVPLPACLPVVDLPIPPRPCRLVGRGGERAVFVLGSVLMICPVLIPLPRLGGVAHVLGGLLRWLTSCLLFAFHQCSSRPASRFHRLGGRLVVPALPSMCFSCVFSVHSLASCACLFCPRARLVQSSRRPSRSVVSSSRLVLRLGRRRVVMCCLLDLFPMAFSSRPCRLVGRDEKRSETVRFRNLFHGIFMYSESIAVLYRAIDIMGNVDMYMAEREPMNIKIARLLAWIKRVRKHKAEKKKKVIGLPKDGDGRDIPLDTKVLYDANGDAWNVDQFEW